MAAYRIHVADDPLEPFRADPGALGDPARHRRHARADRRRTPDRRRAGGDARACWCGSWSGFGLVGCVSGRAAADARAPGARAGHRLHRQPRPGDRRGRRGAHGARRRALPAGAVATSCARLAPVAAGVGAWVEDKGATLAVHYRQAPDPEAAEERAAPRRAAARRGGGPGRPLRAHGARGAAARPARQGHRRAAAPARARLDRRSLFAGDDTTDLDAFGVVDVAVAVRLAGGPAGPGGGRAAPCGRAARAARAAGVAADDR